MDLFDVTDDIVIDILALLPFKQLIRISGLSHQLRRIARPFLWRTISFRFRPKWTRGRRGDERKDELVRDGTLLALRQGHQREDG
jgi:hypothetical protein